MWRSDGSVSPRAGWQVGRLAMLRGLAWVGAQARWVLAVGVLLATLMPSLSATLRPFLPGLVVLVLCVSIARLDLGVLARRATRPRLRARSR